MDYFQEDAEEIFESVVDLGPRKNGFARVVAAKFTAVTNELKIGTVLSKMFK